MAEEDLIQTDETTEESVAAYVFSNGEIVDVNKARFNPKPKRNKKKDTNAMDLDEDDFGEQYAAGRVYRPTLNFGNMKQFSLENLYHARCIKQIALDSTTPGWDIVTVDAKGQPVKNEVKWSNKENRIYTFFQDSFGMDDFDEGARSCLINYDTFGFTCIELTRRKNGEPAKFKLLPTETCRIARNLNDTNLGDSDMRYVVQIVNAHERIFKIFDGERPTIHEPHTGNPMTEILLLRNYNVMGGKYGIPDWVPSLKSMIGNDKVADYNINFFDNEAVPRFAVIVQGGKLDEDTKKDLRGYFKKDLKGVQNAHKTLVLTTPKGSEVKLVPLAFEMKDGGFRYYRKDNRDEIISAHGVPPHRIQVYDAGNNGILSHGMLFDLDKTYKYSIINPHQRKLESIFNRVIRLAFGIKDKQIHFNELDIGEEADRANTLKTIASAHEKYYNMGTMTPDEIRVDNKQEKYAEISDSDDEIKEWAKTPKPVYLLRQAKLQQQEALNANVGGQSVNETPNDFGDKSNEETGNTLNDKNIQQLMMKRQINEVIEKVDSALSSINDLNEKVDEIKEAKHG